LSRFLAEDDWIAEIMSHIEPKPYALLVLTSQLPFPPHQGATIRSYNLIQELSQRSQIDLLSFVTEIGELATCEPLRALCRHVEGAPTPARSMWSRAWATFFSPHPDMALRFASPQFSALLQRRLDENQYDAVLCVGIDTGPYLEQVVAWKRARSLDRPTPRVIFDDLNAEYLLQRRAYETDVRRLNHPRRWAGALYSFIQWKKLQRFEARVCRLADHVVAVSDADRLALQRIVPNLDVTVVPNGVNLGQYRPASGARTSVLPAPTLVFTGKMDFRPNVDAACWFADEVWPIIREAAPQVTFAVVGRDPHPRIRELASRPGILVTGYVEDDLPYFQDATVYVVPLRVGGGTRLKVLTAMAVENAIVSTTLGCEGLGVQNEQELILADTAAEFAAQTVRLLNDDARRRALGTRARQFVSQRYSWPAIAPRLERLYAPDV
jgi:polysaccharide biosynthesis protein PslH